MYKDIHDRLKILTDAKIAKKAWNCVSPIRTLINLKTSMSQISEIIEISDRITSDSNLLVNKVASINFFGGGVDPFLQLFRVGVGDLTL